jgi:hypothetical protein
VGDGKGSEKVLPLQRGPLVPRKQSGMTASRRQRRPSGSCPGPNTKCSTLRTLSTEDLEDA